VKGLPQAIKAIGQCVVHIFQPCHILVRHAVHPKVCSVILHGIILLHMLLYNMEGSIELLCIWIVVICCYLYEAEVFQSLVIMIHSIICFIHIYSWDEHDYNICLSLVSYCLISNYIISVAE
jgi:hypothetical protein